MKKFTVFATILILIALILIPFTYSYGTGTKIQNKTSDFFEVKNEKTTLSDKIQAVINIDKIEYEKFKIKVKSDMNNVEIQEEVTIEKENNSVIIEIDKSQTILKQITLDYDVVEGVQIGDKINISVEVINLENEEETKEITKEILVVEENKKELDNEIRIEEEVKIENEKISSPKNEKSMDMVSYVSNIETESNQNIFSVQNAGATRTTASKTSNIAEIYNGSDNNYLKDIIVDGYELSKKFSKEQESYFVKVQDNTTQIEINAIAEDENAKVSIYGNEELKSGTNKVLVNITAQNGNVRTYRIYVIK